jgi:hypothetical protein
MRDPIQRWVVGWSDGVLALFGPKAAMMAAAGL